MKIIVTHISPDVDAITSVWLLKRFLPGWKDADLRFVPAGKTLDNQMVDSDSEIWHVDTGMGILDHHQTDEDTCAAKRCLEYIIKQEKNNKKQETKIDMNEALERLVEIVNDIDHFREVYYPDSNSDRYDFGLVAIFDGWKLIFADQNEKIVEMGMVSLDGIYKNFQNKVWAEKEIEQGGLIFRSKWGKGIALETVNDEVLRIAQKMGYMIVVRKDPKKGYIRIKAMPDSDVDLSECYNKYKKMDKDATWFLHASRKMLLNGSIKNPETKATKLTLREIVEELQITK